MAASIIAVSRPGPPATRGLGPRPEGILSGSDHSTRMAPVRWVPLSIERRGR
jgi:hypothetical protein